MYEGKLWWWIFKWDKAKPLQQPQWRFTVGEWAKATGSCESEQGCKMLLWTPEHANHGQLCFYIDASQINTRVTLCINTGPNPAKNIRLCIILNIPSLKFNPHTFWSSAVMLRLKHSVWKWPKSNFLNLLSEEVLPAFCLFVSFFWFDFVGWLVCLF